MTARPGFRSRRVSAPAYKRRVARLGRRLALDLGKERVSNIPITLIL